VTKAADITCSRCRVSIPAHLIDFKDRCISKDCPFKAMEQKA
jgi:hypothetical protein